MKYFIIALLFCICYVGEAQKPPIIKQICNTYILDSIDNGWHYYREITHDDSIKHKLIQTKPLNIHIDTPTAISLYARLLADTPIRLDTTSDVYHQWSVQNDSVQSEIVRSDKTGEWVLGDNPGPALNLFYKMYMDLKKEKELAEDILKYLYTDGTVSNLKKFKAAVKEFSEYKKK